MEGMTTLVPSAVAGQAVHGDVLHGGLLYGISAHRVYGLNHPFPLLQPLKYTKFVNGPSYRKWKLPLPIMSTLYRWGGRMWMGAGGARGERKWCRRLC